VGASPEQLFATGFPALVEDLQRPDDHCHRPALPDIGGTGVDDAGHHVPPGELGGQHESGGARTHEKNVYEAPIRDAVKELSAWIRSCDGFAGGRCG
jgi:hypothetical protein